jgi:DNA-binding NtrC family response regulator
MTATGPILVLSDEPFIAALVGLLLELAGHRPVFADTNEQPADALDRQRPIAVILIDAEMDAARSDLFFALTARRSVGVVVYGSESRTRLVGEIAAERKIPWCTLPASAERLNAAIKTSLGEHVALETIRGTDRRAGAEATRTADGTHILQDLVGYQWVVYDRRSSGERRVDETAEPRERVFVREDGETRRCDISVADEMSDDPVSMLQEQLARASQ